MLEALKFPLPPESLETPLLLISILSPFISNVPTRETRSIKQRVTQWPLGPTALSAQEITLQHFRAERGVFQIPHRTLWRSSHFTHNLITLPNGPFSTFSPITTTTYSSISSLYFPSSCCFTHTKPQQTPKDKMRAFHSNKFIVSISSYGTTTGGKKN